MALIDYFRRPALLLDRPARGDIASPWADRSALAQIVLADVAGLDAPTNATRTAAMTVPAIVRARAIICGTLARQPLTLFDGDAPITAQPRWLSTSDTNQTPRARHLWTVDDILFTGMSLWVVQRDNDNTITDAVRLARHLWDVRDGRVVVDDGTGTMRGVSAEEVILFEGPQEGLLTLAADQIAAAIAMRDAWKSRVQSPVPLVSLQGTDINAPLTDREAAALVAKWESARRLGGTAYLPAEVRMATHGETTTDLFVAGRNAERLDFANLTNLSANYLDGSLSTASLTYTTTEGKRSELVDISLAYWADQIEARLSGDDVCPPGTRVAFDLQWTTNPTAPAPAHKD